MSPRIRNLSYTLRTNRAASEKRWLEQINLHKRCTILRMHSIFGHASAHDMYVYSYVARDHLCCTICDCHNSIFRTSVPTHSSLAASAREEINHSILARAACF